MEFNNEIAGANPINKIFCSAEFAEKVK